MSHASTPHIVLTVFGSLGDLYPIIALGKSLQAHGCRVTLATVQDYQLKIETEGLGFYPLRSTMAMNDPALYRELFDPVKGPEVLMKKYLLPHVKETYEDLRPLLETVDFLVNSPLVYAGPVLAEQLGLPWAAVALQPMLMLSAWDPPVLPPVPWLSRCHGWGPTFWRPILGLAKASTASWPKTVYALRDSLGLPQRGNPIFEGQFSPDLNLAMFSPLLGSPQPDWPKNTHCTGFAFFDGLGETAGYRFPEAVQRFLDAGEPPVVFTLGSSAVNTAGNFYETSIQAVRKLGCRALFLTGSMPPTSPLTDRMLVWNTLPHAQIFPHAAAVVHQGGAGTTAQALRAEKPMIIVPFGFDQFDNATRMHRLGVSKTLQKSQFTVETLTQTLESLLADATLCQQAQAMGRVLQQEDGARVAAEHILACLAQQQRAKNKAASPV
jgi:UDP:flavonoid glycosyltransferase YjiC (YdhE family)